MATIDNLCPINPLWTFRKQVPTRTLVSFAAPIARPIFCSFRCSATPSQLQDQIPVRRSGNYQPSMWEFNYIQTQKNEFAGDSHMKRRDELKSQVKMMLENEVQPLIELLELIDNLQRLGLSYHFKEEIKSILANIYEKNCSMDGQNSKDLYATALEFRLMREHGFNVPQEVFDIFRNENGEFNMSIGNDTKGMLYLFEASYLSMQGESTMDLAREFATKHLKNILNGQNVDDQDLASSVHHALELPLPWRVPRIEARWFIDEYRRSPEMNPILLELAELDFNIVQATHQEDLKFVSSWWKSSRVAEKLTFVRDRVVENFFWTIGVIPEPQYGECRRALAKLIVLATTTDDIYDVYGTLDELEPFTDAIERWDIKAAEKLPDYMKICFLLFYNSVNEMAYDVLKEQGAHVVQYLSRAWAGLCKGYFQEAKWYYSGYTPTLDEYMENAWVTGAVPVMIMPVYAAATNPVKKEALESIESHNIIRWSSTLLRLADDLGTSPGEMQRGDVAKSIQCYMKETGCSEEEAREHIWFLWSEVWKKMIEDSVGESQFDETVIRAAKNFGRVALAMYQHGDGHGLNSNPVAKDRITSLLFEPIPLSYMTADDGVVPRKDGFCVDEAIPAQY